MPTPIQHKIFQFIQSYINEYGYSPSLVEIAEGIGISPKSISLVSRAIHSLVEVGWLKFYRKGYRNIEINKVENGGLPIIGQIAAGAPIEAIEDHRTIDLNTLFRTENHFLLKVRGTSMVEEGIFDGDLVICKSAKNAHEGDIVVALIDKAECTLKKISYRIAERITLIPANPELKPKAYLPNRIEIQGIYVGLLRLQGH